MPRSGLDRAAVVRAAVAMLDASPGGRQELSLARLAEALHVRPPSLYKHIDGLPALERDVALCGMRRLGDILMDAAVGRAGDDAVRALAAAYRSFAREHPGLYAAALRAPAPGDTELEEAAARVVGLVLRVLGAYGREGDDAVHAVRALRSMLHGFVSLELNGGFGLPLDLDESYRRLVETLIAGLRQ